MNPRSVGRSSSTNDFGMYMMTATLPLTRLPQLQRSSGDAAVERSADCANFSLLLGREKKDVHGGVSRKAAPDDLPDTDEERLVLRSCRDDAQGNRRRSVRLEAHPGEIRSPNIRPSREFEDEVALQRVLDSAGLFAEELYALFTALLCAPTPLVE